MALWITIRLRCGRMHRAGLSTFARCSACFFSDISEKDRRLGHVFNECVGCRRDGWTGFKAWTLTDGRLRLGGLSVANISLCLFPSPVVSHAPILEVMRLIAAHLPSGSRGLRFIPKIRLN